MPKQTLELVYPLNLFKTLCEDAMKNVKKYYIDNNINPYSCFNLGTYWLDELNTEDDL